MESTIAALAQLGPVGIVLIILVVVGYQWRQSVRQANTEIKRLEAWYTGELERQEHDHERDIGGLRRDLQELKTQVTELRAAWEDERHARMAAEETAHQLRLGNTCVECGQEKAE